LHDQNGKVLQNLDNSDFLKNEIAYTVIRQYSRPWYEITAMAKNYSTRRKSPRTWIRDFLTAL